MTFQLKSYWHEAIPPESCQSCSSSYHLSIGDKELVDLLQSKINRLLAGEVSVPEGVEPKEEDKRPFAPFLSSDKERAQAVSSICEEIAKEEPEGTCSLQRSVDQLYTYIGILPYGMVEHAAKIFLTHSKVAQKYLYIPPLFARQPNLIRHTPS